MYSELFLKTDPQVTYRKTSSPTKLVLTLNQVLGQFSFKLGKHSFLNYRIILLKVNPISQKFNLDNFDSTDLFETPLFCKLTYLWSSEIRSSVSLLPFILLADKRPMVNRSAAKLLLSCYPHDSQTHRIVSDNRLIYLPKFLIFPTRKVLVNVTTLKYVFRDIPAYRLPRFYLLYPYEPCPFIPKFM